MQKLEAVFEWVRRMYPDMARADVRTLSTPQLRILITVDELVEAVQDQIETKQPRIAPQPLRVE